jgi:hypothetical protein
MPNIEQSTALQEVRNAKKAAGDARSIADLAPDQRSLLENLCVDLDGQEDILILEAIDKKIDALKTAGTRLEETAGKISREISKLQNVAEIVDKAAKAIKILVDVAAKAGTLGA